MPVTNYDGMLEAWADQATAMEANIEAMYGPPSTPSTLPSVTNYDGMLEAIAEQSYNAYINIAKVSGAYHDSVTNVYAMTLPSTLLDWFGIKVIGGKTIVWNQLVVEVNSTNWQPYITPSPCTYTFANNSYTATIVTKLESSRWQYCARLKNTIPLQTGHKYYFSFVVTCSTNMTVRCEITNNGSNVSIVGGVATKISQIQTATKSQTSYYVYLNTGDNVGESYTVATPMLVDLTLMFGAGNEPTTVQEFEQMFPSAYYEYNAGQLMSAGVTEVVSVGKNIFNKDVVYADWTNPIVDYYYTLYLKPNTTYFCYGTLPLSSNNSANLFFYASNDSASTSRNGVWNGQTRYVTTLTDGIVIVRSRTAGYTPRTKENYLSYDFMLVESETPIAYIPYNEISYPIPAEIQALTGYGWSAGSVYNYIDFERKVYVQNVDRLVLDGTNKGVSNVGVSGTTGNYYATVSVTNAKSQSINIVSDMFLNDGSQIANIGNIYTVSKTSLVCVFTDQTMTTTSAINTYLTTHNAEIYYELDTPIETDISQYLTDDYIAVEGGGTITFENQNGDDYRIPVPVKAEYIGV